MPMQPHLLFVLARFRETERPAAARKAHARRFRSAAPARPTQTTPARTPD